MRGLKLVKCREQRKMPAVQDHGKMRSFLLRGSTVPSPHTALFLSPGLSVFLMVLETGSHRVDLAELELLL